jgi:nitrate reductase delta subunit
MMELKAISRLMDYPTAEVQRHAAELRQILVDCPLLGFRLKSRFCAWLDRYGATDLIDLQEEYSGLFDRGRATSLLLFEHVHGESRDRGQAMVDLMALYGSHGFVIDARELPDYIPMYLEFLSQRPQQAAEEGLLDVAHILALVGARLEDRGSEYGLLFRALLDICQADISVDALLRQVGAEARDDTPAALDRIWEEEAVSFGMDDAAAGACQTSRGPLPANENQQTAPVHFIDTRAPAAAPRTVRNRP